MKNISKKLPKNIIRRINLLKGVLRFFTFSFFIIQYLPGRLEIEKDLQILSTLQMHSQIFGTRHCPDSPGQLVSALTKTALSCVINGAKRYFFSFRCKSLYAAFIRFGDRIGFSDSV